MVNYTKGGHWRPTIPDQTCGHCATVYTAHRYGQRFCSNECKFEAKKVARVSVICAHCGNAFERRVSDKDLTCSKECRYARVRKPEKLHRTCAVCGVGFEAKRTGDKGITCSAQCLSARMSQVGRGRKPSAEANAKRSASLKMAWADPDRAAEWRRAAAKGISDWHENPDNAEAFAARMSARMRRLHTEPEFQARRDVRSSVTMKKNWDRYRDLYEAQAVERHFNMMESGTGLYSPAACRKRSERSKWIMTKAQEALHAETDYDAAYTEVQARLRAEAPYDAVEWNGDYMGYCQKLGRAVVGSPECREIADSFLSKAIPRFSEEWAKLCATAREPSTKERALPATP